MDVQQQKQQLLQQITQRSLATSPEQQQSILATVAQIRAASSSSITTDAGTLSATWKLLWTTEKETLFIIQNARWFGTKAGEVYQVNGNKEAGVGERAAWWCRAALQQMASS